MGSFSVLDRVSALKNFTFQVGQNELFRPDEVQPPWRAQNSWQNTFYHKAVLTKNEAQTNFAEKPFSLAWQEKLKKEEVKVE